MPSSTILNSLKINKLTESQFDAAVQQGIIGANDLSILIDADNPNIQVNTLPTASIDELDKIYQYVGATDSNYTNGYFYKCVSDGQSTPTYSWTAVQVQAGGGLPSQTGQSGKFLTTDGTDASWGNALVNTADGTNNLGILGTCVGSSNSHGIAIGINASSGIGSSQSNEPVAIGYMAKSKLESVAIGGRAEANTGDVAIGYNAKASVSTSVAVGDASNVSSDSGIALGFVSKVNTNSNYGIAIGTRAESSAQGAIQLGGYQETNSEAGTFKVGLTTTGTTSNNYKLLDSDGTIPTDRFTTTPNSNGSYLPTLSVSSGTATRSWTSIASSVTSSSTNAEAVGAKLFYDTVGNIEAALQAINSGNGGNA